MADFTSAGLLAAAKTRFGEKVLRDRMRGAAGVAVAADLELTKIAAGVIGRVQAAAAPSVGWPLPGTWPPGSVAEDGTTVIGGAPYSEIWPKNLLQHALDLFNWRTVSGLETVSENQRRVGKMAEDFFNEVENGGIGLGLSVDTEPGFGEVLAARNRDGSSNVVGVPDHNNILDIFYGRSWDG